MNAIIRTFGLSGISLYVHGTPTYPTYTSSFRVTESFVAAYRSNYRTHRNSNERISMTSVCLKYLFWQGKIIQDKNTLSQGNFLTSVWIELTRGEIKER